jgi:PAS domain S-box-containing protein
MARRFGWASPLEGVGLTDFDLFPDELARLKFADEQRVMETGEPMIGREERDRTPDGRIRWLSSSKMPLRDRQGRIVGTFGISRDITARIEAETRQESIGRGLRKVLELTEELMGCRDEDSLFRMAVELGRTQLGLERCAIFISAGDSVRGTFGTSLRGETTDERSHRIAFSALWKERFRVRSSTGIRWQVSDETLYDWDGRGMQEIGRGAVAVTPIQSAKQEVIGVFCNDAAITGAALDPVRQDVVAVYCTLLGNIVARLRAERNRLTVEERQRSLMERTDRINTLGLLAAGMAHEINNPLQGMVSHVRALQPFIPVDSSGRRNLDMVQKAIESISSLVRRLLALGSADESGGQGADLQECLDFVSQLLESQLQRAGIRLEREPLPRPVVVSMPRAEFVQILMNLLINARDATPTGGRVRVSVGVEGTYAVVTVSDTGQGMPAEVLRDIFTPFFTTKGARGSGLGLSITDSLVRTAGGRIEVASEVGRGTVFKTYLPLLGGTGAS